MSELIRMSVSIEQPLFRELENLVARNSYANRSEFVRDMIRDHLARERWDGDSQEVIATIQLVYDHHQRELSEKLTETQHQAHHLVLTSTHVHLDRKLCAEMIMVKGPAGQVRELANNLRQRKGVLHAGLVIGAAAAG